MIQQYGIRLADGTTRYQAAHNPTTALHKLHAQIMEETDTTLSYPQFRRLYVRGITMPTQPRRRYA